MRGGDPGIEEDALAHEGDGQAFDVQEGGGHVACRCRCYGGKQGSEGALPGLECGCERGEF